METLFRFAVVRPANEVTAGEVIPLARKSAVQTELIRARSAPVPREAMRLVASAFIKAGGLARGLADLRWGIELTRAWAALAGINDTSRARAAIEAAFGRTVEQLEEDSQLRHDDERLADSVVALRVLSRAHGARLGELAHGIRTVALIRDLAVASTSFDAPGRLRRALTRPLAAPAAIFPIPASRARRAQSAGEAPHDLTEAKPPLAIDSAIAELLALDQQALVDTPALRDAVEHEEGAAVGPGPVAFNVLALTDRAAARLSATTRAALAHVDLDPTTTPVDRLVRALERVGHAEKAIGVRDRVRLIGSTPIPTLPASPAAPAPSGPMSAVPMSRGTIRSAGVADLLVVRQTLVGYEPRDIAHVENVLRGESKHREHRRSTTTEVTTFSETLSTREQERELDSTERFEMSRSASEVISEDARLASGLTVSGSYGPTIDFAATVEGSIESSRERSVELASGYARDVTERSRTKVAETVRSSRTVRVVTSVEELNEHTLDNASSTEHIRGVYQWLEKRYEAQVWNYGLRAMFDFVVPEPAAFVIHALKTGFADATEAVRPADFTIRPRDITPNNYGDYVRLWEASGIEPPPASYVTVPKTFRGGPDAPDGVTRGMAVEAVELPLPEGYRAVRASAVARWGRWDSDAASLSVRLVVGERAHEWAGGSSLGWVTQLDGEHGALAMTVRTNRTSSFTVAVEVTCQRTERTLETWQLATHAALLQAYQQRRSAYEERLRTLRARTGVEISGKNPAANRAIEQTELKRAAISILTDQQFELFDAIDTAADGIPQPDVAELTLEGPYIRFFEQAFEWHNATYLFYPYFWGRRSTWVERVGYDDTDPQFAAFLRAGSARLSVPVRPGFEAAIDHFLATGEIWLDGELPSIGSELYVPVITELSEQLGAPGEEVPHGDPWEVAVPTALVLVRTDDRLPSWHKNEQGRWVPDE